MNTFVTRSFSAIVFIVVMVGCIWWNIYSYVILFAIVNLGCTYEFIKLSEKILPEHTFTPLKKGVLYLVSLLIVISSLLLESDFYLLGILIIVIALYTVIAFVIEMLQGRFYLPTLMVSITSLVYISIPLCLINLFGVQSSLNNNHNETRVVILSILLLIWTNDTMAYITGMFIGKHPFAKHISPKKTWEGIIGGVVFTVLMAWIINEFTIKYQYRLSPWWFIGPCVSVLATIGDLAESMLKRNADVKDSGRIMPGHGGFLDRFDAMLMTMPLVILFLFFAH